MARRGRLVALTVVGLVAGTVAVPVPAGAGGDDTSVLGSVVAGAEGALGPQATAAVARAYDRGYDGLQIAEGLVEGGIAADGTITEDDEALAPARAPSGVVAGSGTSAEAIALDALERGIQKTTKRLDKKHDLGARAERIGASGEDVFTMLVTLAATFEGYTPEQIVVDGLMAGGFRISPGSKSGIVIVDENGKPIPPGAIPPSEEQQESEAFLETFVADVADVVAGVDPRTAAETPFDKRFDVAIDVRWGDDTSVVITGKGGVGVPADKALRRFWVGSATGALTGSGACSVGGGARHPWTIDGNVVMGISGRAEDGRLQLRFAITEANLGTTGDDSLCVDIVRDTADALESLTLPSIAVPVRGGKATLATSLGGDPMDIEVTLSS